MNRYKVPMLVLTAGLALSLGVSAQITYVDAQASGGNTTLADGSPYTPISVTPTANNDWDERAYANSVNIFSSNDIGAEDAPMIRTAITGLSAGTEYFIYGYFWGTASTVWRGRALVDTVQPAPGLPGYNTVHFNGSAFAPMQPLGLGSPSGYLQTSLDLNFDAAGFETSGHFANSVMIQEGNRWLFEILLGVFPADASGEIFVYIDDLENQSSSSNRTWYDGVGYEAAPARFGSGCGSPTVPTIGSSGAPIWGQDITIELSNAPASSPCSLLLGFSNTTWSGLPLPLDLGPVGFPGCPLNVSFDIPSPAATDGNGDAALTFPSIRLYGAASFYWQWIVLTPAGPTLLHVSEGLETLYHR